MRQAWPLVVLALALVGQGAEAPERVRILFAPAIVWAGEPVVFSVRVEPAETNRLLVVAAYDRACSGDLDACGVRQSREQLDGTSRATRQIAWRGGLVAGELMLLAVVFDHAHEVGRDQSPLTVLARGVP